MKVACISASRVPSTTANSIQVMKACQAISQLGHEVHLFVPKHKHQLNEADLLSFYGLNTQFSIEWLSSPPGFHRYDFAFHAVRMAQAHKGRSHLCVVPSSRGIFSPGSPAGDHRAAWTSRRPVWSDIIPPVPETSREKSACWPSPRLLPACCMKISTLDLDDQGLIQISPNGVDLERYQGPA